eukprot:XP_001692421.1 predicted protein [Chlamydomonas reinhardtii]
MKGAGGVWGTAGAAAAAVAAVHPYHIKYEVGAAAARRVRVLYGIADAGDPETAHNRCRHRHWVRVRAHVRLHGRGRLTKGREAKGRLTKGRQVKGRLTKGREVKGRLTKGRQVKGRLTKGRQVKGRLTKGRLTKGWQAVTGDLERAQLIIAGAGTGKTTTLIKRILYLIQEKRVPPRHILCITFTNKAAAEVRDRLDRAGVDLAGLIAATFHSWAYGLLRTYHRAAGFAQCPTVWKDADLLRAVALAIRLSSLERGRGDMAAWLGLDGGAEPATWAQHVLMKERKSGLPTALRVPFPGRHLRSCAEQARQLEAKQQKRSKKKKRAIHAPTATEKLGAKPKPATVKEELGWIDFFKRQTVDNISQYPGKQMLFETYTRILRDANAIDFNDMMLLLVQLIRVGRGGGAAGGAATAAGPVALVSEVAGTHGHVTAVGDDAQSIYRFRGAAPGVFGVVLELNYRSTPRILSVGQFVLQAEGGAPAATAKTLRATKPDTGNKEEAEWIAAEVERLNKEEALRHRGIPFRLVRDTSVFERREVQDLLAYLRLALNPADDGAFLRVYNTPPRRLGDAKAAFITRLTELQVVESLRRDIWQLGPAGALVRGSDLEYTDDDEEDEVQESGDGGGEGEGLQVPDLFRIATRALLNSYTGEEVQAALGCVCPHTSSPRVMPFVLEQVFGEHGRGPLALRDFLAHVALSDKWGLEFPAVFVARWSQGYLPTLYRPDKKRGKNMSEADRAAFEEQDAQEHTEEERRLAHVAVTRAMERLYITSIRVGQMFGEPILVPPSSISLPADPAVVERRVLPECHVRPPLCLDL